MHHTKVAEGLRRGVCILAVMMVANVMTQASAQAIHEGVASCAGSICHGATKPFGDRGIRQDEYFIWQQKDVHRRALQTLSSETARRIGQHLGVRPTQAPQCLACHSESPPPELRGERFLASDGIGCETCHGGSGRWLAEHTRRDLSLDDKIAMGMTPTWQPEIRARLCLSCHQGDDRHPITHAMMAAGHPPLLFELDTFSALQPPHHDQDADYQRRKGAVSSTRDWAVGQATAAALLLGNLASPGLMKGAFPELMHFDCAACHHDLDVRRWMPGRNGQLPPGTPPLSDAHLYWLAVWLEVVAPELAAQLRTRWSALLDAQGNNLAAMPQAAIAMRSLIADTVLPLARQEQLDPGELRRFLLRLSETPASPRARDFGAAEQAAMAALVFSESLPTSSPSSGRKLRAAINGLYEAVKSRRDFDPERYRKALEALHAAL